MRPMPVIAALAAGAVLLGCSSGGTGDTSGPGDVPDSAVTPAEDATTVIMEVTGPARADITYGLNADQSQANGAKLPWKKTMTTKEAFSFATVSAQNTGSGTIKCKLTVGGKVVKTNASEGQYAIVTCSADGF